MAKFEVRVGKPFEVDAVEIEEIEVVERRAAIEERRVLADRQARIAYAVLGAFALASVAAAAIGWTDGSYNELVSLWTVSSGWMVMILRPYFKKD